LNNNKGHVKENLKVEKREFKRVERGLKKITKKPNKLKTSKYREITK